MIMVTAENIPSRLYRHFSFRHHICGLQDIVRRSESDIPAFHNEVAQALHRKDEGRCNDHKEANFNVDCLPEAPQREASELTALRTHFADFQIDLASDDEKQEQREQQDQPALSGSHKHRRQNGDATCVQTQHV